MLNRDFEFDLVAVLVLNKGVEGPDMNVGVV